MTAQDAGTQDAGPVSAGAAGTGIAGAGAAGGTTLGAETPGAVAGGTGTAGVPAARPPVLDAGPPGEGTAPDPAPATAPPRAGGVARAAGVTAGLSVAGSVAGLVRDQAIARLFGAGALSDAFLVAWTVPEIAATVLIEDAMALVMVPAFSAALARAAAAGGPRRLAGASGSATPPREPAGGAGPRELVRGTLPRLLAVLAALTAALAAAAPFAVDVLAPGLADPGTAVACTRLTALTVLGFGAAGYLSAALRAHRRFVPPAAIYVAYNAGIVTTLFALHGRMGVRAAATGVAVGAVCMVAVQLPAFLRALYGDPAGAGARTKAGPGPAAPDTATPAGAGPRARTRTGTGTGTGTGARARTATATRAERRADAARRRGARRRTGIGVALLAPVVLFTLGRQAQVLVERFFAAPLPAGAISHLNYAQKVAQLPMALSLMVCTVTFPAVSRALATGDRAGARRRVERDLGLACLVVLLGAAYVIACAPQIIHVLFQRGEFDAADSAATAGVMRVYALGLLGQSLVGALVRPYFSAARPTWYPAAAMGAGLLVTAAADAAAAGPWGAYGIAAGNAAGITVTAALLLRGLAGHPLALRAAALAPALARTLAAALAATAAGWAVASRLTGPASGAAAGALTVTAVFAGVAAAAGVPEARPRYLLALVTRKARP